MRVCCSKEQYKKLIEAAHEAAMEKGADVEFINIAKLNIKGCLGCTECKKDQTTFCCQKDDMAGLYTKLNEADVILLGSPVYFGDITGQNKCFVDRMYAYLGPAGSRLKKGKQEHSVKNSLNKEQLLFFILWTLNSFFHKVPKLKSQKDIQYTFLRYRV